MPARTLWDSGRIGGADGFVNRKAGGLFCFVFVFVKRNCFIKKKGLFTQSKTPKCKEARFGFHVGTEESLTHQAGCKCRQVG